MLERERERETLYCSISTLMRILSVNERHFQTWKKSEISHFLRYLVEGT